MTREERTEHIERGVKSVWWNLIVKAVPLATVIDHILSHRAFAVRTNTQ